MMKSTTLPDPFSARAELRVGDRAYTYYRLDRSGMADLARAPMTVKVLLENVIRHAGRGVIREEEARSLAAWRPNLGSDAEVPFMPARVLMQDFTGVPAVVDLAALRDAMAAIGGDPALVEPLVPADLVIDHSVQVDRYRTPDAFAFNVAREYERNGERYALLRWAQSAFAGLRVVPPGTGIVHQVNLEYLAAVVATREDESGTTVAFPDTLVGTDSHTTMINGLGVLGFGVGGIEAEAVLLGQPLYQPMPRVVGVRLHGDLPRGSTATDLVLVISNMLRTHGVVGSFVEFAGDGLASLALADRATISNMAPEYGATAALFPIDGETLAYLRQTGRDAAQVALVEAYAKENALWREPGPGPQFDETLELDLGSVEPTVAGPRRPQDKVRLPDLPANFHDAYPQTADAHPVTIAGNLDGNGHGPQTIDHGSVAIAAITSCTNTSNPTVMVGAGLLARNALARGLTVRPTVKTSLAPGSRAVTEYLQTAGLLKPLEELGFGVVGYGCTTCIGNSGPLDQPVAEAIEGNELVVAAVLSGNRNFEGRIHPLARASYLASPPLVVAFALAGTVDIDLASQPLGTDRDGKPVYLADIWPTPEEIKSTIASAVSPGIFNRIYGSVFDGDEHWRELPVPVGSKRYEWDAASTYVARPPFMDGIQREPAPVSDIYGARALAVLGDSVTTDHISPAGSIPAWSPAGTWLQEHGVGPLDFNSYGARRGHHEVLMRGTFGNIRLRNALSDKEGPYTAHQPSGEHMFIYEAAMRYASEGVPLVVLAGKEYGSGSSRDWAAKGPALLGVRAVLAETYERIHRSNLVGMGVLPLQYLPGQNAASLGLTGHEIFSVVGLADGLAVRKHVTLQVRDENGTRDIEVIARIDGPVELDYYRQGGIMPAVLRRLAGVTR
ncbi:MAG: aconitate hydratase [Chloroflexota bacterium]|jgi:aconitate hydratase|nr:aconitate hydratase [Chloroflexota bacterium]